jgi:hypothetical protein
VEAPPVEVEPPPEEIEAPPAPPDAVAFENSAAFELLPQATIANAEATTAHRVSGELGMPKEYHTWDTDSTFWPVSRPAWYISGRRVRASTESSMVVACHRSILRGLRDRRKPRTDTRFGLWDAFRRHLGGRDINRWRILLGRPKRIGLGERRRRQRQRWKPPLG